MRLPSLEPLQAALDASPIAAILCDDRHIPYANEACARLLGYPTPADVCRLDPLGQLICPDDRSACRRALLRLLNAESAREQLWLKVLRQDGSTFHADVRAHAASGPQGTCACLTLVDATPQIERLRRHEVLVHAMNVVPEAVLVVDGAGRVHYANPAMAQLLGVTVEGLIGIDARTFALDQAALDRLIADLDQPGPERHACVETSICRPSGGIFPAEVSLTVFREADDRELGVVIVRDLTERNRLEQERAQRERQLALMLREAHHRIKNNLQVASDILALQASASSLEVRRALRAAANRIRALAAVHEGLRTDRDVTEVDAKPLIEAVIQDIRETVPLPGGPVGFEVTVEERAVTSRAASALALIAAELVTNAIEHGKPGTIRVWFRASADTAALEVRDDGQTGLPSPEVQEAGFGLKLARLLAEEQLHGGFSLSRGDGWTIARVAFPLLPTADASGS
jgi:PAS domain S-box-containing protein